MTQPPQPPYEPGNNGGSGEGSEHNPYSQQSKASGFGSQGFTPTSAEAKGFFGALFDFSFQSYVTVKFAKLIYILLLLFIALWLVFGWLIASISIMSQEPVIGIGLLLLGWIPGAVMLVLARVGLEFYIAMIRTAQNTAGTRQEIEALRRELTRR
ncbi:DUF4282 domain-containing protein [Citricoccus muralis]|uniref:DUF4282 domain-containing protein n=1 Tax=Citricoccus muralis TaxID=169134 RepID=A0ABY8H888_9MICC|nr:DUF4282 domain-containing protein [Citricoccus muralis]WFP16873.1 DUF4282 domain-containing protein [Citricoccus muralis]